MLQGLALPFQGQGRVVLLLGDGGAQGPSVGAGVRHLLPVLLGPGRVMGIQGAAGRGQAGIGGPLPRAEAVPDALGGNRVARGIQGIGQRDAATVVAPVFGGLVVGHGLARVVGHRAAPQCAQLAHFHRLRANGLAYRVAMAGFSQAPEQLAATGRVDAVDQRDHARYVDRAILGNVGAGQALQQRTGQAPLVAVVRLLEQLMAAGLLTVLLHQVCRLVE
ncbi:hypothetical protein D3C86_1330300 [compost metagenome]